VSFGWAAGAYLKSYTELPGYEPIAIMTRRNFDPARIKAVKGQKSKNIS